MNSEDMCSEISQIQILHNFTYMRYLKKLNLQKKKKKHGYHLLGKGWDRKLYFGDHTVSV